MLPNIFHRPLLGRKTCDGNSTKILILIGNDFHFLFVLNFGEKNFYYSAEMVWEIVSLKIVFSPAGENIYKKISHKNICVYLHFKMKNFLRLEIHATLVETRKLPKSFFFFTRKTNLYHFNKILCLRLCVWIFNICWMKLIFSLRLYNKLGIFRGLNPPTRTLISFTKKLFPPFFSRRLLHNAEILGVWRCDYWR